MNEFYFSAKSPMYESLRTRYFESNDFINVLKCLDKGTALKIGNYLMKTTKLRKDTMCSLQEHQSIDYISVSSSSYECCMTDSVAGRPVQ